MTNLVLPENGSAANLTVLGGDSLTICQGGRIICGWGGRMLTSRQTYLYRLAERALLTGESLDDLYFGGALSDANACSCFRMASARSNGSRSHRPKIR